MERDGHGRTRRPRNDRTTDCNNTGGLSKGSATYEGAAAGKYAMASTTDRDTYEGGHFTAMATLMADFDVDTWTPTTATPANDRGRRQPSAA